MHFLNYEALYALSYFFLPKRKIKLERLNLKQIAISKGLISGE